MKGVEKFNLFQIKMMKTINYSYESFLSGAIEMVLSYQSSSSGKIVVHFNYMWIPRYVYSSIIALASTTMDILPSQRYESIM